jgi:hypothetical protein
MASSLVAGSLRAADPDPHEADRKQLLAIFAEVEGGINDQNIDRMLEDDGRQRHGDLAQCRSFAGQGAGESLLPQDGGRRTGNAQEVPDEGEGRRAGKVLR